MTTKELFPDSQRRYVTFALPSADKKLRERGWWDKSYRSKWLSKNGACLVFGTGGMSPASVMSSVAVIPFVRELLGSDFWLTGFKDKVVAAHDIVGKSRRENPPIHFGCVRNEKFVSWSEMRLDKFCLNVAKFSNCYACDGADDLVPCVRNKLEQAMEEMGINIPFATHWIEEDATEALYNEDDMERYLRSESKKAGWTYIKPGNLVEPFTPKLASVLDIYMDEAEEKLQEGRERWERGKETTAAVKRCEDECYVHAYCSGPCKPYHGLPSHCQKGTSYMRGSLTGPYSEEEINETYRVIRERINARPEHEIRQIAAYGGTSTWIFGYELELCKMDSDLRNVQFVRPTTMKRFTYSYEDAMTLLHTPYRHGKEYEYPGDGMRRIEGHGLQYIEAKMSEKSLNIYMEACQYDSAKEYSTWYPGCYATPYIRYLKWNIFRDTFNLVLKPGYSFTLDHVGQTYLIMERNWCPLPSIAKENLEMLRAARGEADQETKQGKQP